MNWKTSLGGLLAASGQSLLHLGPATGTWWIGFVMSGVGLLMLGGFAKDRDVAGVPTEGKP